MYRIKGILLANCDEVEDLTKDNLLEGPLDSQEFFAKDGFKKESGVERCCRQAADFAKEKGFDLMAYPSAHYNDDRREATITFNFYRLLDPPDPTFQEMP